MTRNERRRRVYRFHKLYPGENPRGKMLNADGTKTTMQELVETTIRYAQRRWGAWPYSGNALLARLMAGG